MARAAESSSAQNDSLAPGTYRSLLPNLDDILAIIGDQSTSPDPVSPVEASEAVAAKVSSPSKDLDDSYG